MVSNRDVIYYSDYIFLHVYGPSLKGSVVEHPAELAIGRS